MRCGTDCRIVGHQVSGERLHPRGTLIVQNFPKTELTEPNKMNWYDITSNDCPLDCPIIYKDTIHIISDDRTFAVQSSTRTLIHNTMDASTMRDTIMFNR